ncbi:putative Non-classical export protein 2 [Xylogone sp. PMI_703]|nr:putative Non-classical export protein 2 [Xylogone sp. PMI_703]
MISVTQAFLRCIAFLWTVLIMALIGNVIDNAFAGNPSAVNYAMFVAAFSMLVVLYGIASFIIQALAMPLVLMVLDALATIFTFIAGVVLAAKLHVHSCSNRNYTLHNSLTNGAHDMQARCRELQASTAFFWFLFATYVALLVFDFIGSRGSRLTSRGNITRGGPSMSQV